MVKLVNVSSGYIRIYLNSDGKVFVQVAENSFVNKLPFSLVAIRNANLHGKGEVTEKQIEKAINDFLKFGLVTCFY